MTTRRTCATGPLLLLAGLALGLVLAGPVAAAEPGPAYPPGAGADDVVQAGEGTDPVSPPGDDGTEVGDPATEERPDDAGPAEAGGTDDGDDDEVAGEEASQDGAPEADESRIGPILVVIGTAILLGGAVVAIARRI